MYDFSLTEDSKLESFKKKEEKLDSLRCTYSDKYSSYHQITFVVVFQVLQTLVVFHVKCLKRHTSSRGSRFQTKLLATVLSAAMKVNPPSLPTLLPLRNAADFNICKFIFPRLHFPDHHLSRHCQLLIRVRKVSLRVLDNFFSVGLNFQAALNQPTIFTFVV